VKRFSALVVTVLIAASANAKLEFAKTVTPELKQTLTDDMLALAQSRIPGDAKLKQLTGAASTDGLGLLNWIDNRVNYIIPDGLDMQKDVVPIGPHVYENTGTPDLEDGKTTDGAAAMVVMSNVSGGLYLGGKDLSFLFGLKIDGKVIPITSPRVGILMIGPGLTGSKKAKSAPSPLAARYLRQSVLMHEARHSDGRGKSLAFAHAVCRSGDYDGYNACDANSNGPYTIGAQFLKMVAAQCADCTPADKEWLQKASLDSFARIIAPKSRLSTSDEATASVISTYKTLIDICEKSNVCVATTVEGYRSKIRMLQGQGAQAAQAASAPAPSMDATPEGKFDTVSRDETWKSVLALKAKAK